MVHNTSNRYNVRDFVGDEYSNFKKRQQEQHVMQLSVFGKISFEAPLVKVQYVCYRVVRDIDHLL